jgi:hypothetical protein
MVTWPESKTENIKREVKITGMAYNEIFCLKVSVSFTISFFETTSIAMSEKKLTLKKIRLAHFFENNAKDETKNANIGEYLKGVIDSSGRL